MTNVKTTIKTTVTLFTIITIGIIILSSFNAYCDYANQLEMTNSYWFYLKDLFITTTYRGYEEVTLGYSSIAIGITLPICILISMILKMIEEK